MISIFINPVKIKKIHEKKLALYCAAVMLAFVGFQTPLHAQTWVPYASNERGDFYIDVDSVRVSGQMRRAWIIYDKKENDPGGTQSHRRLMEYDCEELRSRTLTSSFFRESMARGVPHLNSNEPGAWSFAPPGTPASEVIRLVCGTTEPIQKRF